eukprot:988892-Rhodomonas_salina.3
MASIAASCVAFLVLSSAIFLQLCSATFQSGADTAHGGWHQFPQSGFVRSFRLIKVFRMIKNVCAPRKSPAN